MNKLELCQRLHQEIGAGPGDPGTAPTTTIGQTGELRRYVSWIEQAWTEIQESQRYWNWMIEETDGEDILFSGSRVINNLIGQDTDVDKLLPYTSLGRPFILCVPQAGGVYQEIYYLPWEEFNGFYDNYNYAQSVGRPMYYTHRRGAGSYGDGNSVLFFPTPDQNYLLKYKYRITNQSLVNNTDIPLMPVKYHMLIVYLALCYYGRSNEANRIQSWLGNGLDDRRVPSSPLTKLYRNLCNEQLPDVTAWGMI